MIHLLAAVAASKPAKPINFGSATAVAYEVGAPSTASLTFQTNGLVVPQPAFNVGFQWLLSGAPSAYEILVTGTGDALGGSSTGVWLSLSTNRTWTLGASPGQHRFFDGTYSIRYVTTGDVIGTALFQLQAEADVGA